MEIVTTPGEHQKIPEITRMSNSMYYFVECVYIIIRKDNNRLVVMNENRVLCDCCYKTIRGCKVAFVKRFQHRTWKRNIKPAWTPAYQPEPGWLERLEKLLSVKNVRNY